MARKLSNFVRSDLKTQMWVSPLFAIHRRFLMFSEIEVVRPYDVFGQPGFVHMQPLQLITQ